MLSSMISKAPAILIACFCINFTVANELGTGGLTVISLITTDTSISSSPTAPLSTNGGVPTSSPASSTESEDGGRASATAAPSDSNSTSATATISSIMVIPSDLNPSSTLNNSSILNSTAPGGLPITPAITPGFSAAGILLIFSGAAYTLLGIRYKYLHVFLSAAYLTSLTVAVLIIYTMSLPVSNSTQGAYVTASILTGIVVGGASTALVDMIQGLGCLLGGFTFSMWLLVLRPGGLITSRGGRVGFITALTFAGFSTSFSHFTRPYGLIFFISFSGSTAIVLGVDCFSRLGLKEFWVYLWNINNDLVAIGTSTYPLSKGLYAEIAVIIVLSLAGIASQANHWRAVKKQCEQRAAEQLEDEKARAEEEANIGRGIESFNARDREQWEAAHGNKDEVGALPSNGDSGVSDMDSQKKSLVGTVTSVVHPGQDEIEMAHLAQPSPTSQSSRTRPSCINQCSVVTFQDVPKDVQCESGLDPDGVLIANSLNLSSHTSTKHLSYGEVPNTAESNPEDTAKTIPKDNMPLSACSDLLRHPSYPSNPSHPVHCQYSGPSPVAREQQLASFRLGIQREWQSSIVPNELIARHRSMLRQEKQIEGQKKAYEQRNREEKKSTFGQSMRRGDMLNAHREAMSKMQAVANKQA